MDLNFLEGSFKKPPRKTRAGTKAKEPVAIWKRMLEASQAAIAKSIEQAEEAIENGNWASPNNPVTVGDTVHTTPFAAKNWSLANRAEYEKNGYKDGWFNVSMTVGTTTKFKILPRIVYDSSGNATFTNEPLPSDKTRATAWGSIKIPEAQVLPTLKRFKETLDNLSKDSAEGKEFWAQAKAIAKPNIKKGAPDPWRYDAAKDLWVKSA